MIFARKATTEGTRIKIELPVKGNMFLVKNMSGGDIYVSLEDTEDKEKCILIPDETAQVIEERYAESDTITIIPDNTSERGVEVQCLRW